MAAGILSAGSAGGGKRRRRRPVMSEINVTPFVDVMLVLLIVFMVSAPLLTVGVPIDLPQSQAKALPQDNEPLTISVNVDGKVFLQDKQIDLDDLVPKLKAIIDARHGDPNELIYVRGDRKVDYGTMMRVMGQISGAGYHRVALVTNVEQGEPMKTGMTISCVGHARRDRLCAWWRFRRSRWRCRRSTRCRCNSSPKRTSPSSRKASKTPRS